jgi:hypothetical protein
MGDETVNRPDAATPGACPGVARTARREMAVETFSLQRSEAWLPLVGEAGFQETLDRFSGGRDEDGAVFPHHAAVLVAEPDNRFDHDAVAVYICDETGDAEKVGYLSQEAAVAYGPVLQLVHPNLPMCLLAIHGGWDRGPADRRYHSASLNLGSPAEMAAEWFLDRHPPRGSHPWRGTTVAFLGHSPVSIGGIALDEEARALLARQAGCRTQPQVGPNVELCVIGVTKPGVRDDERDRERVREAEERGIRRLAEPAFWSALGYELESMA